MRCAICENACDIDENGTGVCAMYTQRDHQLIEKYPDHYLVVVSAEVESMPMVHFHPGGRFLQICTIGCNLRCGGCVSWMLTERPDNVRSALQNLSPEQIAQKAVEEKCLGIMFCFNEPAVSFHTFKRVAASARARNLLVGCATNAYFTETAFRELVDCVDFINIGIKGCTDRTYSKLGAASVSPVLRNLRISHESGVFTEVAAVYVRGGEAEVLETARKVAALSRDIPFQVMRFIPLAGADIESEPSYIDAENLCRELRKLLRYVYLFNSPGTPFLNTVCPECGRTLVRRGFNGPMCAHVAEVRDNGRCSCGYEVPFVGAFAKEDGGQVIGYYGGYKTISCLESIQTILSFLGERDPGVITAVLKSILEEDYVKSIYEKTKRIESYLDVVDHYAALADRTREAAKLRGYLLRHADSIRCAAATAARQPSVYCSLGHPLLAVFGDKFECNLVETAGGRCVNKEIPLENVPGLTKSVELLNRLAPEIILINQAKGYPLEDFYKLCGDCGLDVPAVRNRSIYNLHPYNTGGRPDWILGLMQMANLIHPELFHFDVKAHADEFYLTFWDASYDAVCNRRSITHGR